MKTLPRTACFLIGICLLTACAPIFQRIKPDLPATPSSPSTPALTQPAEPTQPPAPTATATLALPVGAGTAMPASRPVITPDNLSHLVQLGQWGHGEATAAVWSPAGDRLAVATELGVTIYQAPQMAPLATVPAAAAKALAYSPDGKVLATGAAAVQLWDAVNGQRLNDLGGEQPIVALGFSGDGGMLTAIAREGGYSFRLKTWAMPGGQLQTDQVLKAVKGLTLSLASGGTCVAFQTINRKIQFWDLINDAPLGAFDYVTNTSQSGMAFSADGETLAIGANDMSLQRRYYVELRRVQDGSLLRSFDLQDTVSAVAISPDGSRLAAVQGFNTVRLWNVADGQPVAELPLTHAGALLQFSPDSSLLAAGTLEVWQVASSARVAEQSLNRVGEVKFSPDGTLAAYSAGNTIVLRKTATGELQATLTGHTNFIERLAFSPDGTKLVSGSGDHSVRVWETATGQLLHTLAGHTDWITDVAVSPDGQWMASASGEGAIKVWKLAEGVEVLSWNISGLPRLAFSPAGSLYVTSHDGIEEWKLPEKTRLNVLFGEGSVQRLVFAPDGSTLLINKTRAIKLVDIGTQAGRALINLNERYSGGASYSPDGRLIATGWEDGYLRILDAQNGLVLYEQTGPGASFVEGVDFAPDGTVFAVASGGTIQLWGIIAAD